LSSRFFGHPTVRYLSLEREGGCRPLDLGAPPRPEDLPGKDLLFFLDERKAGVMEFLKALYPGGKAEAFTDPVGATRLFAYRVPAGALAGMGPGQPGITRGLWGVYREGGGPPFLERLDPLVNFTFTDLPRTPAALSVEWRGKVRVDRPGRHSFLVLTYEDGRLNEAGISVAGAASGRGACPVLEVGLRAGWHDLVLRYRKPEGPLATVGLLWKRPGEERYEFIPNSAFGPVR
jgi:hypothetical protein